MSGKLERELDSFRTLWRGGYFEGDPLDPVSPSSYGDLGFMSVLHATYLRCIKPYVTSDTVALEIGPGRGAWTRTMLHAREITALDALPEEHNGFYAYLGHPKHVTYHQVHDFDCAMLADDHFDYMFSFGCLCHVSFDGISRYAESLHRKLRPGAVCFWMVADYDKYNRTVANRRHWSIWSGVGPYGRRAAPIKWIVEKLGRRDTLCAVDPDEDNAPRPGRWYHAGIERTCAMLRDAGYEIVDPDVGTCLRDPIIEFRRT